MPNQQRFLMGSTTGCEPDLSSLLTSPKIPSLPFAFAQMAAGTFRSADPPEMPSFGEVLQTHLENRSLASTGINFHTGGHMHTQNFKTYFTFSVKKYFI
ncbi:hypothetical protein CEXT_460431 [Caerostris extrusa]|uniref:Uncharacterized protein n=1 Tax=Caerostris extrusa TaxID=172846 RepID=A0AAV4Q8I6_CAEEX|nr:hypothetical protein CEXT_460431 [Caerostris extrusa]